MSAPRFLRGPVPYPWIAVAASLPGRALAVGIVIWIWSGILRRRYDLPISLSRIPISRSAAARGLTALERAGLVTVTRHRGIRPKVTLVAEMPKMHSRQRYGER